MRNGITMYKHATEKGNYPRIQTEEVNIIVYNQNQRNNQNQQNNQNRCF